MKHLSSKSAFMVVSVAALALTLPALGQETPESLLPPGFNEPAAPPPSTQPKPNDGSAGTAPASKGGKSASAVTKADPDTKPADEEGDEEESDEELVIRFDVPPGARRSLKQIGLISQASGGFPADTFGVTNGEFLIKALRNTRGPLVSRWGTILTRRMLASRANTPENINGSDWVAERAWLLLRMGDAAVSRQLVQQVDAGSYSKRLYEVSMQSFLANGDLGGMCPLAEGANRIAPDPAWKMARPICASLAGEQGNASALLNQSRKQRVMVGIDYLLAEKAVGAGTNGRRSVKIEWTKVTGFNAWRHGLANATGIMPPEQLYQQSDRHLAGWLSQMPMVPIDARIKASAGSAALGVLSNRNMVDLYAQALDDPDSSDANKARAELLQSAYTSASDSDKVGAMSSLWEGLAGRDLQGALVLTARAAALVEPSSSLSTQSDLLVASMLSAGFDRNAAAWGSVISVGSQAWGLLAVGAPGMEGKVNFSQMDDFRDNDGSEGSHKSALLLAGLAGLGRADVESIADFSSDLEIDLSRASGWSKAISAAADRGEAGTVAVMAAAGMQASDWKKMPARQLYYIVRSLAQVGLEAEARMIAAEAVTFG